jgi:hypothetical protein
MNRRDFTVVVTAMVVIAAAALLVNHYAFSQSETHTTTTSPTALTTTPATRTAVSACQADGATVITAMAAYNANNGAYPTTQAELLDTAAGGPYLESWPNNNAYYLFSLAVVDGRPALYVAISGTMAAAPGVGWVAWHGPTTCTLTAVTGVGAQPATVK